MNAMYRRRTLRYLEIAEDIKQSIENGTRPPGSKLLPQQQLAKEYGVAANTLRQALGVLQNEGFVYSELGRGTFTARPNARKGAILVIDDDREMSRLFRASLDPSAWDLESAASGTDAIKAAARRKFEIIFLDLVMPDLSGPEILIELRKSGCTAPVVVVTGYPDSGLVAQLLDVEAVPFFRKPFSATEIRKTIERFSARSRELVAATAVVE